MAELLTAQDRGRLADLLGRLVAIPSTNTGLEQANIDRPEREIAALLVQFLRGIGMRAETPEVYPGRSNVVAHWPEQRGTGRLVFEAHMDTVGVDGMTVEPFEPVVREGRLYGRGACDAKGAMAAFLTALEIARQRGIEPADKIYFVGAMGEETGCHGARGLVDSGFRCEGAIVGEPTACQVVTAHKGSCWLRVTVHGKSCHASTPELGRNAIVAAGRVIDLLESEFKAVLQMERHELLGQGSVSVGLIEGGTKVNVVPDVCRMEVDLRLLPHHRPGQILGQIRRMVGRAMPEWAEHIEIQEVWSSACMETPSHVPLVQNVLAVAGARTGQSKPMAMPAFADSGPLRQVGADVVVFGPGDPGRAHTADEFMELDQLYLATEIVLDLLIRHQQKSMVV